MRKLREGEVAREDAGPGGPAMTETVQMGSQGRQADCLRNRGHPGSRNLGDSRRVAKGGIAMTPRRHHISATKNRALCGAKYQSQEPDGLPICKRCHRVEMRVGG